jgi:hypothetical protein
LILASSASKVTIVESFWTPLSCITILQDIVSGVESSKIQTDPAILYTLHPSLLKQIVAR